MANLKARLALFNNYDILYLSSPKRAFYKTKNTMKLLKQTKNYLISSFEEIKKVSWPSKKDTLKYTYAVIGLSLAIAVFFGILDYILNIGFELLLKLK